MPSDLEQIRTLRSNYLAALVADSINPKPDYSIDGQTVSRAQWRADLFSKIKELNELEQMMDPFEIRTNVV